jgi:Arc/MetJ-type ribon-helix-helix transcriptional regulator
VRSPGLPGRLGAEAREPVWQMDRVVCPVACPWIASDYQLFPSLLMNVHLPTSLESSILDAVHSGRYASLDDAMAAAACLLVQHLERTESRGKRTARLAVAISLGTLVWAFVVGFAIFNYSQRITWLSLKERTEEILYFGYAFSIAGAITGVVTCAAVGKKRWAIVICAFNIVLLAASLPTVRWLTYSKLAPKGSWLAVILWGSARDSFAFGALFGVSSAVIVSGLVLASVVLERHTKRWQFGLIAAVMVAALGLWVVPVVAYGLPELTGPYVGLTYPHLYDTSLFAAGITGAGTGSLAGAVVAGLMVRWIKI